MKNKCYGRIESRRTFLKKSTTGLLSLFVIPSFLSCEPDDLLDVNPGCKDCTNACKGTCLNKCTTTCKGTCKNNCSMNCSKGCVSSCQSSCKGDCSNTCFGDCSNSSK